MILDDTVHEIRKRNFGRASASSSYVGLGNHPVRSSSYGKANLLEHPKKKRGLLMERPLETDVVVINMIQKKSNAITAFISLYLYCSHRPS